IQRLAYPHWPFERVPESRAIVLMDLNPGHHLIVSRLRGRHEENFLAPESFCQLLCKAALAAAYASEDENDSGHHESPLNTTAGRSISTHSPTGGINSNQLATDN